MRLAASIFGLAAASAALAQVWEKEIAPGLTYRMEYDLTLPRAVHALRYSPGAPDLRVVPELGEGTVYEDNDSKGRETVSAMVRRTGAIAGINADFFPFTGNPLGLMVREGELLSVPVRNRAVFAWGKELSQAGLVQWRLVMEADGMDPLELDGINDECEPNMGILNGPTAGYALSKQPAICAVIKVPKWEAAPMGELSGEVQYLISEAKSIPVGPDSALVMGHGVKAAHLAALRPGQKVRFVMQVEGVDWSKAQSAVGGGPFLVQGGRPYVDWSEQGFRPEFAQQRHPRTAVGRTAEGDVWWVVVDGRQAASVGATLDELAAVMVRLGCVDAINLDGGGSTAMNLLGMLINRSTDGSTETERKVANGVLFYGSPRPVVPQLLTIPVPEKAVVGQPIDLSVRRDNGEPVDNRDVIWSAVGAGFVDQGGRVYPLRAGNVTVNAYVLGQFVTSTVLVEAPAPPTSNGQTPTTGSGGRSAAKPVKKL